MLPPSEASDRLALEALFKSCGGAGWKRKGGWMTEAELGEWDGVAVDAEGRVVQLTLGFNKLVGRLPSEIQQLSALQELWLNDNEISGPIPAELAQLGALKELDLSGNQLSGPVLSGPVLSGPVPPEELVQNANATATATAAAAASTATGPALTEPLAELGSLLTEAQVERNRRLARLRAGAGSMHPPMTEKAARLQADMAAAAVATAGAAGATGAAGAAGVAGAAGAAGAAAASDGGGGHGGSARGGLQGGRGAGDDTAGGSGNRCPLGHALVLRHTDRPGYSCDRCRAADLPVGTELWGCREDGCDFDVCRGCRSTAPLHKTPHGGGGGGGGGGDDGDGGAQRAQKRMKQ
jgi:hypothetical protein